MINGKLIISREDNKVYLLSNEYITEIEYNTIPEDGYFLDTFLRNENKDNQNLTARDIISTLGAEPLNIEEFEFFNKGRAGLIDPESYRKILLNKTWWKDNITVPFVNSNIATYISDVKITKDNLFEHEILIENKYFIGKFSFNILNLLKDTNNISVSNVFIKPFLIKNELYSISEKLIKNIDVTLNIEYNDDLSNNTINENHIKIGIKFNDILLQSGFVTENVNIYHKIKLENQIFNASESLLTFQSHKLNYTTENGFFNGLNTIVGNKSFDFKFNQNILEYSNSKIFHLNSPN